MKILRNIAASLIATSALALGTAGSAEAGHSVQVSANFGFASHNQGCSPWRPWNCFPTPRVFSPRPVHVHSYHVDYDQVWVPPVYDTIVVGYSPCGTPIYRTVIVQQGYYRTARYNVCGCGHRQFLGY